MAGLGGVEAVHRWTSPDGISFDLNVLDDLTTGAAVSPSFRLLDVSHGLAEGGDSYSARVGQAGTKARRDFRGSRLHTYTVEVKADNILELREAEEQLRAAFYDQSAEGRMDVNMHPLNDLYAAEDNRYFNAKPISLTQTSDEPNGNRVFGPQRREWVLVMRNHAGVYYEDVTSLAAFKRAILGLQPSLYWPLDTADGATDLSGNGRDGTAQGGVTLGGSTSLLAGIAGDDSTDFDGSNDAITSSYDPFGTGPVTVIGWAKRDATASDDVFFGGTDPTHAPFLTAPMTPSTNLNFFADAADAGSTDTLATWPGTTAAMFAVTLSPGDEVSAYVDGALGNSSPDALGAFHASTGNFEVGYAGNLSASLHFDGKIAHVAVFERILTVEEIAAIYGWASGTEPQRTLV